MYVFSFVLQNVKVSHSLNDEGNSRANVLLSRTLPAPIGPGGKPMKTSVCDEIHKPVEKAEEIEKHIKGINGINEF